MIINFLFFIILGFVKSELVYYAIGNVTDTSLTIKAKTSGESITFFLGSTEIPKVNPDGDYYCTVQASSLSPNTKYSISYKLNEGAVVNLNRNVTTLINPLGPSFFSFIVSSNGYSNSNKLLYKRITELKPSFFLFLGNFNVDSVCSDNWKDYESVYLKSI